MLQIKGTCSHSQTLGHHNILLNKIILLMGQMGHCNLSDCPINQAQSHTLKCKIRDVTQGDIDTKHQVKSFKIQTCERYKDF